MWQQVRQRMCLHGEVPTGGPEWLLSLAFTSWLGFLPLPLSLSCSVRRKNWSYTEHLSGIEKNMPRFLFVEHFNSIGHSLKDVEVHSSMVCGGNTHRKRQKIRLIFRLGTSQPRGLNALSCIRARIHKNWNRDDCFPINEQYWHCTIPWRRAKPEKSGFHFNFLALFAYW